MIAPNPSLSDQVKSHLKQRIVGGEFAEGRIPSEQVLAAELGVSRATVREALSRLEHEGAIYRKQGAGTFVNQPGLQIKSRLEEIWSYEDVLRDHGYEPSVKMLRVDTEPADHALAEDLGINVGDTVVVIEKLFLEDAEPVVLTVNRIAELTLRPALSLEDAASEPVFRLLETHSDRRLSYYVTEIVPVALSSYEAEQLGVAAGTPALAFDEIGFDRDNTPVVRATSTFRDDLLRFRLIRRKTD